MRARLTLLGLLLATSAACTRGVEGLSPPDASPDGGVTLDASLDAGVALDASRELCAELSRDRGDDELTALRRIGFSAAQARVEGRLGPAERRETGLVAPLSITRVHFGARFLEGQEVWVEVGASELASTPGDVLAGLDARLPMRADDGRAWARSLVIAPIAERAAFEDVLGHHLLPGQAVGVVEVVAQDEDTTTLRVIETLVGELPDEVVDNWSRRVYFARFPVPGPERYLATFDYVTFYETAGRWGGSVVDLRPVTEEARRAIAAAAAEPAPFEPRALDEFSVDYLTSWRFHRAPLVVETEVTGIADECCTGAGGTYVEHGISEVLRGVALRPRLVRGGHAYYSDERCGDRTFLALPGLAEAEPPAEAFRCGESAILDAWLPVTEVIAEQRATEVTSDEVRLWLEAAEPNYLLQGATAAPSPQMGHAPWSEPRPVAEALWVGTLVRVEVVAVRPLARGHELTLETTFSTSDNEVLPRYRPRLAVECVDPRWLVPGRAWIVPVVREHVSTLSLEEELAAGGMFLAPGALFPAEAWVERTAAAFVQLVHRLSAPR